jgi:hypothetical protein
MGDVSGEGVIELGHHGRAKNNCNTNSWFSASSDLGLLRGPNESSGIDPPVQGLRNGEAGESDVSPEYFLNTMRFSYEVLIIYEGFNASPNGSRPYALQHHRFFLRGVFYVWRMNYGPTSHLLIMRMI